MKTRLVLLVLLGLILIYGCINRTGEPFEFNTPKTKIFLKEINLSDSNSFSGRIRLYWSGESNNGFIKGFEIAHDTHSCNLGIEKNWVFTNRTDSAFLFAIPPGATFSNISFYVRAVDNNGLKDPNPPCLQVPVKNSIPVIKLERPYSNNRVITDTVHSVITLRWEVEDPDGSANLDTIFVKINSDGDWIPLPKNTRTLTLIPENPKAAISSRAKFLLGNLGTNYAVSSNNRTLKMETLNTIYFRVKDVSKAFSAIDSTNVFYLKRQKSDFLYIRSYAPNSNDNSTYLPIFNDIFTDGYDYLDLLKDNREYIPLNWNLTFSEQLKLYKSVFWSAFTQRTPTPDNFIIENAAFSIQNYLNNNGKLMLSMTVLTNDQNSLVYQIFPFDSTSSAPGQARISNNAKVIPEPSFSNSIDTLSVQALITGATPAYLKQGSIPLFTTNYTPINNWTGPNVVAGATRGTNNKLNFIVFTTDLFKLNGNPASLKKFFQYIFQTEFKP